MNKIAGGLTIAECALIWCILGTRNQDDPKGEPIYPTIEESLAYMKNGYTKTYLDPKSRFYRKTEIKVLQITSDTIIEEQLAFA